MGLVRTILEVLLPFLIFLDDFSSHFPTFGNIFNMFFNRLFSLFWLFLFFFLFFLFFVFFLLLLLFFFVFFGVFLPIVLVNGILDVFLTGFPRNFSRFSEQDVNSPDQEAQNHDSPDDASDHSSHKIPILFLVEYSQAFTPHIGSKSISVAQDEPRTALGPTLLSGQIIWWLIDALVGVDILVTINLRARRVGPFRVKAELALIRHITTVTPSLNKLGASTLIGNIIWTYFSTIGRLAAGRYPKNQKYG